MNSEAIRPGEVAWSGDNSGIYLKHEPDGDYVTRASYFRVTYSPYGIGNVLVLLSGSTNVCLHDNEALARWLVADFARHFPQFRASPEMDRLDYAWLDVQAPKGTPGAGSASGSAHRGSRSSCTGLRPGTPSSSSFPRAIRHRRTRDVFPLLRRVGRERLPRRAASPRLGHGAEAARQKRPTSFLALSETWVAASGETERG